MSAPEAFEKTAVDNGCANGCNAPFGVRCSVCNTEKRQPSMVLCQCANHHRWFGWPNVVNVCLTCSGAAVNGHRVLTDPDEIGFYDGMKSSWSLKVTHG